MIGAKNLKPGVTFGGRWEGCLLLVLGAFHVLFCSLVALRGNQVLKHPHNH